MKHSAEEFLKQYIPLQPAMQRMAEYLLHDEQEAADVVQDCFVALWKERKRLAKVEKKEAYCIKMVKNRCLNELRRRKAGDEIDETIAEEEPEDSYEEQMALAMRLIEQLPQRQAEAIRLRHLEGMDTDEIAAAMGTTEGNVYTMLSRAYQKMKELINPKEI